MKAIAYAILAVGCFAIAAFAPGLYFPMLCGMYGAGAAAALFLHTPKRDGG